MGGKWTIFRRMGQDVVDYIETQKIAQKTSKTSNELLIDAVKTNENYPLKVYGKAIVDIKAIQDELNNHELLKNLQENQALLKTILRRLELQSENPEKQQEENVEHYRGFLQDIQDTFEITPRIDPK